MSPRKKGPLRLTAAEGVALEQLRGLGGVDVTTHRIAMRLEHTFEQTLKLLHALVAKGRVIQSRSTDGLERLWSTK